MLAQRRGSIGLVRCRQTPSRPFGPINISPFSSANVTEIAGGVEWRARDFVRILREEPGMEDAYALGQLPAKRSQGCVRASKTRRLCRAAVRALAPQLRARRAVAGGCSSLRPHTRAA